jgi:hypothetical protein
VCGGGPVGWPRSGRPAVGRDPGRASCRVRR